MELIKVTPLTDRVIIKVDDADEISEGGIIIPENARKNPPKGIVVLVGKGKKDDLITVKEGDHVLFSKAKATDIQIDGQYFLILQERDIKLIL